MSASANLKLEYRGDSLVITTQGREVINRMEFTVRAIGAAIRARPVRATLIDLRSVPGELSFMDRYQLGEMGGRYLAGLRIGVLTSEAWSDNRQIGKLVAMNRGVSVEVFTDPVAALAWLDAVPALGSRPPFAVI
jgi:hypothetical protein